MSTRARCLIVLLLALAAAPFVHARCFAEEGAPRELLKSSRRIVFLGDSITAGGGYVAYFDAWLTGQRLANQPQVINLGLASETVSGLSEDGHADGKFPRPHLAERLDRVLKLTKPDLVFACYGINCGIYQPLDESRFAKYRQGIEELKSAVEATGAKFVIVTPPFYDDARFPNSGFSYNDVLDRYSEWLVSQREKGWQVVDLHTPMTQYVREQRKQDAKFTLQPDAVHPNDAGHWFIARQLIGWFGDAKSAAASTPEEMLTVVDLPGQALPLVKQRMSTLRDAYVATAGHKRPGVAKGLPVDEAEAKARELTEQIARLIGEKDDKEAAPPVEEANGKTSSRDWPAWRGPEGTGVAAADQKPPLEWSETKNVVWKAPIPGRGHSSPTVVGDRVYIATAEEDVGRQLVLAFDRASGKPIWTTEVHTGGLDTKGNKKTTQASATVACDGNRLYINFLNRDAIYTTALDLDGKVVWQTRVSDFKTHQGFGSSPTLFREFVYVTTDNPAGGVVAALNRDTGEIVWKQSRPEKPNYASAQVYKLHGKEQVLVQGCDLVSSFHPQTGDKLWEIEGATTECVTNIVTDGERIFVSGGYPRNHVQAIVADGSGKTAWENGSRVYVPSMVVKDGYLYGVQDGGVAMCWKTDTGEEMWKSRIGGTYTASLVLVGDLLFATSEEGKTLIFKANPEKYELVAENQLGDEAFATPAICDSRIYTRVNSKAGGQRQEWLYCLGQ